MKKLLIMSMVLVMAGAAAYAATSSTTSTTYTEQFINKQTQKLTDAEKKLQAKQQENQEAVNAKKEKFETKKNQLKELLSD